MPSQFVETPKQDGGKNLKMHDSQPANETTLGSMEAKSALYDASWGELTHIVNILS